MYLASSILTFSTVPVFARLSEHARSMGKKESVSFLITHVLTPSLVDFLVVAIKYSKRRQGDCTSLNEQTEYRTGPTLRLLLLVSPVIHLPAEKDIE